MPLLARMAADDECPAADEAFQQLAILLADNDVDPTPYLAIMAQCLRKPRLNREPYQLRDLRVLGPKAAPLLPYILSYLDATYVDTRHEAIRLCGAIGPAAASAAPRLLRYAAYGQARFETDATAAIQALGEIGAQPRAFTALAKTLLATPALKESPLRETIYDTLIAYGPQADDALPLMRSLLESESLVDRIGACRVLAAFGPVAAPALSRLYVLLDEDETHEAALEAILEIRPR
ncbi:MAG: hypothetical protein QM811_02820 [Pirellulales bacterium]